MSTCTRKRTGLVFCTVACWDAHVPVARHKESWAIEMRAPSKTEWDQVLAGDREDPTFPKREKEKVEEPEVAIKRDASGDVPRVILRRTR